MERITQVQPGNGYTIVELSADPKPVSIGDVAVMTWIGLAGGAIGLYGGFFLGLAIAPSESAAARVGIVTGSLLLPYGVHLANERRGKYPLEALVSLGFGVAALVAENNLALDPGPLLFIALPVSQLITSIAIEVRTSR